VGRITLRKVKEDVQVSNNMSNYQKILVAVDLSDETNLVLNKALALSSGTDAEIHLLHVLEPVAVGYAVEVTSVDIEGLHAEATEYAREAMKALGATLSLPVERQHITLGQPAREIRELAKTLETDLVIMGGHGKHGFELLFGSTSSGVTHGITCDLLIVHLPN
jgi:universal stress protein A